MQQTKVGSKLFAGIHISSQLFSKYKMTILALKKVNFKIFP